MPLMAPPLHTISFKGDRAHTRVSSMDKWNAKSGSPGEAAIIEDLQVIEDLQKTYKKGDIYIKSDVILLISISLIYHRTKNIVKQQF